MALDPALVGELTERIAADRAAGRRPWVVGIGGPQGSGKSTLAAALAHRLRDVGVRAAVLSLDDLYLDRAERARLARQVHPLLATRGPPGTHDPALGLRLLDALGRPGPTALPRFDKAADDRAPASEWERVDGPVHVVLFEGWMLGARPDPTAATAPPLNALERDADPRGVWRAAVEAALTVGYPALWSRIDLLVQLQPPSFETVPTWRMEQEHALRARFVHDGAPGRVMTDAEVAGFVQHYERITRRLMDQAPGTADILVRLDAARRVLGVDARPAAPS